MNFVYIKKERKKFTREISFKNETICGWHNSINSSNGNKRFSGEFEKLSWLTICGSPALL